MRCQIRIILLVLSFLLVVAQPVTAVVMVGFGQIPEEPVYDYCVREDGSAAIGDATDCSTAASSMSVSTFNASSFSAGDIIYFSGRGGTLTGQITIPSSGSGAGDAEKIYYKGEPGYLPTASFSGSEGIVKISSKNYLELDGFALVAGSTSLLLIDGTSTGVVTRNLTLSNSNNQCVQHLNSVSASHYNLHTSDCDDEGVSGHDTASFAIYDSDISGHNGINWVSTGAIVIDNSIIRSENSLGYTLQPAGASYNFTAHNSTFIETAGSVKRVMDFNAAGTVEFANCIFKNLGTTDYYILMRSALTVGRVMNSAFYSGSITGAVVFNQLATGVYKNNIFHTTTSGAGKGYYQSNGVDNTSYYLSGSTYVGTTYTTTDPLFVDPVNNDFHIQAGSPSIDQGSDLSAWFTDDIDGVNRSGEWDIGPDER